MKTVVFGSDAEKAEGLTRFSCVPADTIFLFPYTMFPWKVHTNGMLESIWVYELDGRAKIISRTLTCPNRYLTLKPNTRHIVETSYRVPEVRDFRFLKHHLR